MAGNFGKNLYLRTMICKDIKVHLVFHILERIRNIEKERKVRNNAHQLTHHINLIPGEEKKNFFKQTVG